MQLLNTIVALMVINNAFAEAPEDTTMRGIEREHRILLAQAQSGPQQAQATRRKGEGDSRTPSDEEALALAAMEGLIMQPAERALPIIKRVLAGSQSTVVKQRALFVLSQIDTAEAQEILLQTARSSNEELRGEAIRSIGIGGNPQSLAALQGIYKSGDESLKQEVLQAWMIADRKEDIYQAAISAQSEEEANHAIRLLGTMGAVDELRKLGDRPNASSGLVDAYALSGDLAGLRKVADGSGDASLRRDAVRKIGLIGSDEARSALREIYATTSDEETKDAALQGMLMSGDEEGVLTLYRAAKTADEKRRLLRFLSMMDSDAALQAIDATLEGGQ